VFTVATFHSDATVKTSSPLLDCHVNHSLVKFIPCRHDALTQQLLGEHHTVKVIFEQIVCGVIRTTKS